MSDLVAEFCSITGASPSVASSLLAVCNNSLEMAINMHMEGGGTAPEDNGEASDASLSLPGPSDEVRAPIPQKMDTLIEPGYEGYPIAKGNPHKARIRSVFDGFRNFSNETQDDSKLPVSRKKKRTLEELFKPPLDLTFKGTFRSARDTATSSKKWLLVNIQDAGEFQCQLLNRDVWSNEAVRTIMKEHFVFWQQYVESEDAQRYVKFYPVDNYPYVSVIDPRTGEKLVEWNKLDSSTFCDLVAEFLSHRLTIESQKQVATEPPPSKKLKSDNSSDYSVLDATEEDQIAMAIKASLQASKEAIKNIDSDSDASVEEDSNSSFVSSKDFPSQPNLSTVTDNASCDSNKSNATRHWDNYVGAPNDPVSSIMIRYPDGKKESMSFPSTSRLLALILYIVSKGYPSETHEIITNFPRRILTDLDDQESLKFHGLFPQETVFVQTR